MAPIRRKRPRDTNRPKLLLVDDKVEVRSVEEGFQGSWHTATIIACENLVRRVQYDNLLGDDGSEHLIECVNVWPMLDGVFPPNGAPTNYRGHIRPLPPPLDIGKWCLHYGLCVDVFHQDAWWEGVIFDHEDGSEERKIFFPDIGDELNAQIEILRVTQDWDEVNEDWKPRGKWLFLELIEELEQEWPLLVSVKQIWYEIRIKDGFENLKEWTSSARDCWTGLLLKIIMDNFKFTCKEFFDKLNSSEDLVQENQLLPELSGSKLDAVLNSESYFGKSHAVIPFKTTCQLDGGHPTDINYTSVQHVVSEINQDCLASVRGDDRRDMNPTTSSIMPSQEEALHVRSLTSVILPSNSDEVSRIKSSKNSEGFSGIISKKPIGNIRSLKRTTTKHEWLPAGPEAEFCPDAVTEYAKVGTNKDNLTLYVKKHLLYMGWKIEFMIDRNGHKSMTRLRYISPAGKTFQSLLRACRNLMGLRSALIPRYDLVWLSSPISEHPQVCEAPKRPYHSDLVVKPEMPYHSVFVAVKPECCPRAVLDYYMLGLDDLNSYHGWTKNATQQEMKTKAKQHLSYIGWSFYYVFSESRRQLRYRSPGGKKFNSLRTACKFCMDEGGLCNSNAYTFVQTQNKNVKNQAMGHLAIKGLSDELRSNKRAREVVVASSYHHTPRTVLSWLIDNNVVLPRAKVYYRSRKDGEAMAEGRITRDGIKCNCCKIVFTLSNFEAHAGSTNHRPSANIFLEDGRSLMECQLQLKRNNNASSVREDPHEVKGDQHHSMNDYICSVCQYGGELVLCDQCPSSFHISCLGLKDVPDGIWFCPSCCCGICCQSSFDEDTKQFTDNSVLNCDQCERQYHIDCLRKKGLVKLDSCPKVNWFCNDRCEQIFLGLRRLLGKPIPMGVDNLTWTLMKYIKIENFDSDAYDIEASMENYSKLSLALGVMHECFEPLKEPHTRRDLVEDVIFSRCSKLNRLNFRGFYTIVLEKNDELISVATLRVYGEKVAEVPLVGTRLKYRRLGMCRILMNEIEKNLKELGVERLVLPAIPSVLNTWTTSFGFLMMTEPEKLNFLDYTLLGFQGTIMCQKLLMESPATELSLSKVIEQKLDDDINGDSVDLDRNSVVSDVFQADQIEESEIVGQGHVEANGVAPLVNQPTHDARVQCQSEINPDFSVEASHQKEGENIGNGHFKCYKRRKISTCES